MIGLGITTRNRPNVFGYSLTQWYKYLPKNTKIVIVDDASDIPLPIIKDSFERTFRFEKNVGIAIAKNKCLEFLEDCDEIFLADDDIYPLGLYWEELYTKSGLNHACFTFGRNKISSNLTFYEFEKPCGCLLYFKKICLKEVGGWDTEFKGYGFEHVSLSDRIFNAGLTPARYIDVPNSGWYFSSLDKEGIVESSVPNEVRAATIPINRALYEQNFNSKQFKPYK